MSRRKPQGTVGLQGLRIDCIVGIYDHERTDGQELFVDVDLEWDFEAAARSERVKDTLDYDHIADLLTELAQERQYQLIETFAWEATEALLARYPACGGVAIEIRKPAAVPAAEAARVRLHRSREDA